MAKILVDDCGADVLGSPTVAFRSSGIVVTKHRSSGWARLRATIKAAACQVRGEARPSAFPARFAIRSISSRSANSPKERETAGRADGCGLGKPIYTKTKGPPAAEWLRNRDLFSPRNIDC